MAGENMAIERKNGQWKLSGPLTLESAGRLLEESKDWLAGATADGLEIDLAGVTDVDSAAVALLLEWQRASEKRGSSLKISSAPERLRAISRISNLEDLLNFE